MTADVRKQTSPIQTDAGNPFGPHYLWRWNEHSVDLHRNHPRPEDFERLIQRDPDMFGYDTLSYRQPQVPKDIFCWLRDIYN